MLLNHPSLFKRGTHVFMLKGRHKDGISKERCILRISHDEEGFNGVLEDLTNLQAPQERIYASAGSRNIKKAARLLKSRMLDNDYEAMRDDFYKSLITRWCSCLMSPQAEEKDDKYWLFDCDNEGDFQEVIKLVEDKNPYVYDSKSGTHIVVRPFNRAKLPDHLQKLIHMNALLLWSY